ncbi:MAG: hypothetical protein LBU12_04880 [Deltaproteobacteria bacterium]|jgi:hypothetical protein|nr:hypothetical protein [Deltaproteobacteria bacterium]
MPESDVLNRLASHLEVWRGVTFLLIEAMGLWLFVSGLMALAGREQSRGRVCATLAAGALMLNVPGLLDALAQTFFAQNSAQALSYHPPAHAAASYVRFAVLLVNLTGLAGVGRGLYLLKRTAGEGGGLPRALVHIVGGVLCVNIVEFIKLLAVSAGGQVEAVTNAVLG